jgi:leucyl-tRNA synthetase
MKLEITEPAEKELVGLDKLLSRPETVDGMVHNYGNTFVGRHFTCRRFRRGINPRPTGLKCYPNSSRI